MSVNSGVVGSPPIILDISRHRNNKAATTAASLERGGLNVWRNSLPAEELPSDPILTVGGVNFSMPPFDTDLDDNVLAAGQYIVAPPLRYDWVCVIATSERRTEDFISLHYSDGNVDEEPLRLSDLWQGEASFGELPVVRTDYMHYPFHIQPRLHGTVWFQRVPITRMTSLAGIRLPVNPCIHIFSMTLLPTP